MLLYLKLAWQRRREEGRLADFDDLREAIVEGAAQRIRPKLMTMLTTMIGHDHPEVTSAVQQQASKVMHTSTLYLSEPMIEFGEMVVEASGIPDARVYFTPSGSEANDAAILVATSRLFIASGRGLAVFEDERLRPYLRLDRPGDVWALGLGEDVSVVASLAGHRGQDEVRGAVDDPAHARDAVGGQVEGQRAKHRDAARHGGLEAER